MIEEARSQSSQAGGKIAQIRHEANGSSCESDWLWMYKHMNTSRHTYRSLGLGPGRQEKNEPLLFSYRSGKTERPDFCFLLRTHQSYCTLLNNCRARRMREGWCHFANNLNHLDPKSFRQTLLHDKPLTFTSSSTDRVAANAILLSPPFCYLTYRHSEVYRV